MRPFPYTRNSATRSHRLLSGISLLTLALTLGATASVRAATYTVSNQDELNAAIAAANNDGDPTSTITLSGDLVITDPALIPPVTKSLTIEGQGFLLSTVGNSTFTADAGATLTINAVTTGSGGLHKDGAGTVILTSDGTHAGDAALVNNGTLRIEGGAHIGTGNPGTSVFAVAEGAGSIANLVVSGAGSTLDRGNSARLARGNDAVGVVTVEKGGRITVGSNLNMAAGTGSTATLNVTDAGSSFRSALLSVDKGQGFINVTNGGEIDSGAVTLGSNPLGTPTGGTATALVSGAHSLWNARGNFFMTMGSLSALDGGAVVASSMRIATGAGSEAAVLVSGTGSQLRTVNNNVEVAANGNGTLTVADGGHVVARRLNDTAPADVRVGVGTGSGTLNIGGGTGEAATRPGTIDAETIQLGARGVVKFNHNDASYLFDLPITGTGSVNQIGSGTTVLTGANVYSGATTVTGGTLRAGGLDTFSAASAFTVAGNGLLDLDGFSHTLASLDNGGHVRLSGAANTTLTVAGDYVGNGGTLHLNSALGGDASPTDLLHVINDTSRTTGVIVTNVGGAGGQTTGDGIRIIQVDGVSAADAFSLAGPAIGGAYRYDLFQHGLSDVTDADGNWYLRSAGLAPTLPMYENYPQVLLGLIALPTLEQRIGDRHHSAMGAGDANETGIWTRIEGAHGHFESGASTSGASYDANTALVQVGLDAQLWQGSSGVLVGGLTAQYMRASADISSDLGNGGNDTDSFGVGATLTWYGQSGIYVDAQAQIASLSSDLSAAGVGVFGDGIDGNGYALSLEAGREIALSDGWSLTPQAQLALSSVDFDSFIDRFGADVSLKDGDSLKGRIGIAANYEAGPGGTKVYGIANLTYEFLDGTAVAVSGVDASFEPQRFGGELGVGGTYQWAGGKYALYGEVLGSSSFEGSYGIKGTAGLITRF